MKNKLNKRTVIIIGVAGLILLTIICCVSSIVYFMTASYYTKKYSTESSTSDNLLTTDTPTQTLTPTQTPTAITSTPDITKSPTSTNTPTPTPTSVPGETLSVAGKNFTLPKGWYISDSFTQNDTNLAPNGVCGDALYDPKNPCKIITLSLNSNSSKSIIISSPNQYYNLYTSDNCFARSYQSSRFGKETISLLLTYKSDNLNICPNVPKTDSYLADIRGCRNDGICIYTNKLSSKEFTDFLGSVVEK